jgi:RimJ/RimL family protein N-acetyltransferase
MSAESDLTGIEFFAIRLALRAFTPADAPEIFAAVSPTITRFMAWDPSPSLVAFAEVWRQWLPRMTAGTDLSLVIRLRATDEFLGVAGIHGIGSAEPAARNRKLEFGSRNPPIASAMAEKPSEQS